ncbi:hypothetical protein [Flammeovirga agarivorans]|uniref:Uncharacterized protein n=1 Tax=Flammeovirga agarivorans TaxID=2726742 RepID=A0A7X8SPL6_9BACT|nr:hypothetical protein [Flammeovirga agarivorans]NLR94065.1 hypothetical protein [Flammeovirga agarivorans]
MKKGRIVTIILAITVIIGQLTVVDYSNLSWKNNMGSFLGILSMILLILSTIFSIYKTQNKQEPL